MRKALFIFNPNAGKGSLKRELADVLDIFSKYGLAVTVMTTQRVGHGTELALKYGAEYEIVIVSGGDGSLNEAVTGLMQIPKEKRPYLGYIAAGSTNDFAKSIEIHGEYLDSASHIALGNPEYCDIGCFQHDRYFTYVAAFGAFTEVTYETPQDMKRILGHPAYVFEAVKRIPDVKPVEMKLILNDGEEVINGSFLFGMISNSTRVGGVKNWTGYDVSMSDGIFELTLVKEVTNVLMYPDVAACLLNRREHSLIIRRKIKNIHCISQKPLKWDLDGEFGGEESDAFIEVLADELQILADRNEKTE